MPHARRASLRLFSITALIATALGTQAATLMIGGTINANSIVTSTTLATSDFPGLGNGFTPIFNVNMGGGLFATFTKGASLLSLASDLGTSTSSDVAGVFTYSGDWTQTAGANIGLAPGQFYTGTYLGHFDRNALTYDLTVISPVPEPAPMASLGIAALVALRRRRN